MPDVKPTNPKDAIGSTKLPLSLVPQTALAWIDMVHLHGAAKYTAWNWRSAGVRASIYLDAIYRHLAEWWNGETHDVESGLPHLAHVGACVNILLDAKECEKLTDDRPPPAPMAGLIMRLNSMVEGLKFADADDDTELYEEDWVIDDEPLSIMAGEREPMIHEYLTWTWHGFGNVELIQW